MPRSVSHGLRVLCLGITVSLTPGIQSNEAGEPDEQTAGQLFVLLRNGEVIRGSINRDSDHVIVKRSGRVELRIPRKQISFIGASLNSVYEHRANQIVEFHADEHLELASWCLQNRLIGPTTRHILRGETIQPDHPQLPLLKARLERFLIAAQKSANPVSNESDAAQAVPTAAAVPPPAQQVAAAAQKPVQAASAVHGAAADVFQGHSAKQTTIIENRTPPTESAPLEASEEMATSTINTTEESAPSMARNDTPELNLPPELIKAYTARIQPLLLNRCGAGHCHGHATTSKFQLHRVPRRRNPPRDITLRNLAATLQQLDRMQPENSPLLTWGQKAHGQMRSKVLAVRNPKQQKLLAAWLKDVAVGSVTPSQEGTAIDEQALARNARERLPKVQQASIQWQNPARAKSANSATAAKVSNVKKDDPFDPQSFNVEFAPANP